MSMHAIEDLVEYSVTTVATASPVPPLAQSICHSLYHLQNQMDCGYTVLGLVTEGGFLKDGTYVDRRSGKCCVTAGSALWKKLLDMGIIPMSSETEVRLIAPLELAEQIVPLASKALAGGDKRGADTLGHWYAFFPLLCVMGGLDDDNAPEPERIKTLLTMLYDVESKEYQVYSEVEFFAA